MRACSNAQINCLKGGFDTIVDAAFLHGADRRLFADLAAAGGFHFVILACEADLAVLTQRVEQRAQQRVDPSDADLMVLTEQLGTAEPLSALSVDARSRWIQQPPPGVSKGLHRHQRSSGVLESRRASGITAGPSSSVPEAASRAAAAVAACVSINPPSATVTCAPDGPINICSSFWLVIKITMTSSIAVAMEEKEAPATALPNSARFHMPVCQWRQWSGY